MSVRQILISIFAICATAAEAGAQDTTPYSPTERLYDRVSPSVCTIVSVDKDQNLKRRGSGFILKDSRLLVTNAHVLAGFDDAEVKCGDQTADVLRITRFDDRIDLVLAETEELDVAGLTLSTRSDIRPGTQIFAFGSPYGLEGTISPGLTSVSREIAGQIYLQISTPISSGSSGGPVTDVTGTVIGITVATLEVAQNINFALPASAISTLPRVDIALSEFYPAESANLARRQPVPRPLPDWDSDAPIPDLDSDVMAGGAGFRGFPFGSPCGEIAVAEYERKLGINRRKGLTRFSHNYSGTLELDVDLLGVPATVFFDCHERFGMVGGHYEILGHRDAVPQIAEEISKRYGFGYQNPISEGEASQLGCRWNFSLPGSRHYRPSERTTWSIDERLRIDLIMCGGSSNKTFVYYGDPVLAAVVDRTEVQKPSDIL